MNKAYKVGDMVIEVNGKGGRIIKGLSLDDLDASPGELDAHAQGAVNGIESLMLALACAGVNIQTPEFEIALDTALDAVGNHE